jgi:hypothetical protein
MLRKSLDSLLLPILTLFAILVYAFRNSSMRFYNPNIPSIRSSTLVVMTRGHKQRIYVQRKFFFFVVLRSSYSALFQSGLNWSSWLGWRIQRVLGKQKKSSKRDYDTFVLYIHHLERIWALGK